MVDDINRDYGRRMYISGAEYQDQMRGVTDKARDDVIKLPHSESKKPWAEDEYPEMEYHLTPFGFDPFDPYPWDDPRIPIDPNIPPGVIWNEPVPSDHKFLGCDFGVPAGPTVISAGQRTWVGLSGSGGLWNSQQGIADDPIVSFGISLGPAKMLTSPASFLQCQSQPHCQGIISIQALDPIDESKYGKDSSGLYPVLINARTRSGATCSWTIYVEDVECPAAEALEYDWDNSPQTMGDGGSGQIFVTGGEGPYTWSVSGDSGWYLDRHLTSTGVNILYNDEACGSATISVTDACGTTVVGSVRSTYGSEWSGLVTGCVLPGQYWTSTEGIGFKNYYYATVGKYEQTQSIDVDACELNRNYYGYATEAEAEAKGEEVVATCPSACDNYPVSGCTNYCYTGEDAIRCQACLDWPSIVAGMDRTSGEFGYGYGFRVSGGGSNWSVGTRCFCFAEQSYKEWICS